MKWIVNDLSLNAQHNDVNPFLNELNGLLELREQYTNLKANLHCSRNIGECLVTPDLKFSDLIMQSSDQNLKSQVLSWVTKQGPFWDDNRTENSDDYFEFQGNDVTDTGLGECSRIISKKGNATSYSFSGNYDTTPLLVDHGLVEERYGVLPIDNIWDINQLEKHIREATPAPSSWEQVLVTLKERFRNLVFSENILKHLEPQPFSSTVYYRLLELCNVLQEFIESRDDNGIHTEHSNEIIRMYFSGKKAWFSDESTSNKKNFEEKLKFINPMNQEKQMFPFHGKIKTPQFRIHFDWPIPANQTNINIVYIGPKLTKR